MTHIIRNLRSTDIDDLLDLEETTYGHDAYSKKEFNSIRSKNKYEFLVCHDKYLQGYSVYHIQDEVIYLDRLVVCPECVCEGIGTALIDSVKQKLSNSVRTIDIDVIDRELVAHLFLKKNGFKATKILKGENEAEYYTFIFKL